jgi:hypothetical protein
MSHKGSQAPAKTQKRKPKHNKSSFSEAAIIAVRTLSSSIKRLPVQDAEVGSSMRTNLSRSIMGGFVNSGQVCKVRLPLEPFTVTVSSGTFAIVYGVQLSQISGYADWQNAFAEFRITDFVVAYEPMFQGGGSNTGMYGGGIRWSTSVSAPSSFSDAIQTDGSVIKGLHKSHSWSGNLSKYMGELDWLNTATQYTNTYVGLLMACYNGSGATNANYGVICGHAEVEFRGLT